MRGVQGRVCTGVVCTSVHTGLGGWAVHVGLSCMHWGTHTSAHACARGCRAWKQQGLCNEACVCTPVPTRVLRGGRCVAAEHPRTGEAAQPLPTQAGRIRPRAVLPGYSQR